MCCFAGAAAPNVSNTRIFARTSGDIATLVYALNLSVDSEVAMILPVPVREGPGEGALTFVNLEGYPELFDDLRRGFPVPRSRFLLASSDVERAAPLEVQTVGAFEASFVPHLRDFGRLDARFRLSDRVWQKLPIYGDYGFAVFRMAPGTNKAIHPMALQFYTRFPDRIFFPTVHVHDGEVHESARFDHSLYYQTASEREPLRGEMRSNAVASSFVKGAKAKALVEMNKLVFLKTLSGTLPNRDFFVIESAKTTADLYQH